MALMIQLQLNPRAKPFVPTVKANKLLQAAPSLSSIVYRGKQEEEEAPVSKHQTQLGRVRWASRGGGGERDGVQHEDKRATTVTELAEGNSSSLPIMCGRWLWMGSTAWEERGRSSTYIKKWAATSSVCRKRGGAASLLFFKLDMLCSAAVSPESKREGRRAKVELDWLFPRVSTVPKHDRRSSSATGYGR